MKIRKLGLVSLLFLPMLFCSGCGKTTYDYVALERDAERTGGSVSFSYNPDTHIAIFGGEGEEIQYYQMDIAKGWLESGCRVGVMLSAPADIQEFDTGILTLDGTMFNGGKFYQTIHGQKTGNVILYPLVSAEKMSIEIKVIWQDGAEEQTYQIQIAPGTTFMKDNTVVARNT